MVIGLCPPAGHMIGQNFRRRLKIYRIYSLTTKNISATWFRSQLPGHSLTFVRQDIVTRIERPR